MNKQYILDEIRRTAAANGGVPLGKIRFESETGIRESDWDGKYWARWSDAIIEAGFTPNDWQTSYDDDLVIGKLVSFIQEIGRYPGSRELKMRRRQDRQFPSDGVFMRLGRQAEVAQKVIGYCHKHGGLDNVIAICEQIARSAPEETSEPDDVQLGFVYLIKSGRYYKLGRTNALGRREYELAIQLPDKATTVHTIKTDDPVGIEAYWHQRFADRRKNGEWFELSAADVKAFKRRKFM